MAQDKEQVSDEVIKIGMIRMKRDPDGSGATLHKEQPAAWDDGFLTGALHALTWTGALTDMDSPSDLFTKMRAGPKK